MNSTTINTKFDENALPKWARNDPYVLAICRTNLAFRCDVFSATTASYRNFLKREARRVCGLRARK